jgi:hypothetical protein
VPSGGAQEFWSEILKQIGWIFSTFFVLKIFLAKFQNLSQNQVTISRDVGPEN